MAEGNGYDYYPSVSSGGASVVQVETLGKGGVFVLWIAAFLSALAILTSGASIYMTDRYEREVRVMQDEFMRMRARLETQGIETTDGEH